MTEHRWLFAVLAVGAALIATDSALGWGGGLFLLKKLWALIDWIQFWR